MLSAKCLFAYVNTYICLLVFFYKILPLLFFLYTGGCDICGNNPRVVFAVWTKKRNFGS